jgi:hypothetical protein
MSPGNTGRKTLHINITNYILFNPFPEDCGRGPVDKGDIAIAAGMPNRILRIAAD